MQSFCVIKIIFKKSSKKVQIHHFYLRKLLRWEIKATETLHLMSHLFLIIKHTALFEFISHISNRHPWVCHLQPRAVTHQHRLQLEIYNHFHLKDTTTIGILFFKFLSCMQRFCHHIVLLLG